jgi:pyruvate phosphate dikinase-like enzyme
VRPAAALVALALSACGPHVQPQPLPHPNGVHVFANGLAADGIEGEEHFKALAYHDGGLLLPGRTLKFLIDRREPAAPVTYFMNSNFTDPDGQRPDAAKYHFHLAERVLDGFSETLESFSKFTYDTQDKRYIAGSIQTFFVDGSTEPLYGIQYFPQDVAREATVVETVRLVTQHFHIEGAKVAFVATGTQQVVGPEAAAELKKLGVDSRTLDDVLGAVDFIPLNRGDCWGYLRMFPKDPEALTALDIPVFDELPLDLTVVAGTITRAYQDPTSHVNLKSKERGTPNMVLRSAGPEHAELSRWIDKPVRLTVGFEGFHIQPSSDAEVKAKLDARRGKKWVRLPYEPTDELPSYAEMCPRDPAGCVPLSRRFGSKASMLGFLTSPRVLGTTRDGGSLSAKFGYDLVPLGMGLPFELYRDFVDHPANAELRAALDALIKGEMRGELSPADLAKKAEAVRELFLVAQFPPGMLERVKARLAAVLPGVPEIKVRSSANAEDMPNFDGAGLYTSFAAKLDKEDEPDGSCKVVQDGVKLKVKPKTVACALKGVFGSLWNKRAIEERSYARLDHSTALMGIAIVPDYDLEEAIAANSVVVTRVLGTENVYGYTLATQKGNVLVTNPEPGTLAENTIAAFNQPGEAPSFAVTRFATPVAGQPPLTATVLSDAALRQLVEITRTAEQAYCLAREDYYGFDCRYAPADPRKTRALDFELKYLENGHFVCKQMREFSGR